MKNQYYLLAFILAFYGCQSDRSDLPITMAPAEIAETPPVDVATAPRVQQMDEKQVVGCYVGDFKNVETSPKSESIPSNRITLIIDDFQNGTVKGRSIVAGNSRPFIGSYTVTNEGYQAEVQEPGDDPYDGKFLFLVNDSMFPLRGEWHANRADLKGRHKRYGLQKKEFVYDPALALPDRLGGIYLGNDDPDYEEDAPGEYSTEDVLTVNPSAQRLTNSDVENMYKADLEILRNSIYARHGYSFKNKRIRYVFDQNVDWYIPVSTDVRAELTQLEVANIDLIKRYEEHADRYYDTFGR
ncbi:MAG: YARHG domain-containing protein [Tunicatimonas sp.]